jgi:hypothetical protein
MTLVSEATTIDAAATEPGHPFWTTTLGYLVGLAARMAVLLGLYVLSIGPMYWKWYESKFISDSPWVALFYEPLWLLSHRFEWFGDWLDYYVALWGEWRL